MTGNPDTSFDPTSLMQGWMKTAMENWRETAKSLLESSKGMAATEFPGAEILGRMFREPGAGGGLFPGENFAPQVGLKMAEIWQQGISTLQQAYMKQASGQSFGPGGLPFAGIDPGAFKAWADLYEREAANQFHMPPMGITREHQERTNRMMEAFTRVQSAMTQFLYLTSLPMEKSLGGMWEELSTIVKGEMPAEEFKALYRKWVGILEEKYMALQKSKEYIEVMNKAIDAFAVFKSAKSQWMENYLKMMDVPTQREMDDVYRDLYNLKKEVKELRKALEKR
jgi:class III poly(R)-hydroxyalkanoic acid synthase PhaE subunit